MIRLVVLHWLRAMCSARLHAAFTANPDIDTRHPNYWLVMYLCQALIGLTVEIQRTHVDG